MIDVTKDTRGSDVTAQDLRAIRLDEFSICELRLSISDSSVVSLRFGFSEIVISSSAFSLDGPRVCALDYLSPFRLVRGLLCLLILVLVVMMHSGIGSSSLLKSKNTSAELRLLLYSVL